MLDIQFEIGGRKLEPCFIGDGIEKQTLLYVARQLRRKFRELRVADREEPLSIRVHGDDVAHLRYELCGPQSVMAAVAEPAGDITMEEIVLSA